MGRKVSGSDGLRGSSLAETAFAEIRKAILKNHLHSGIIYSEQMVAKKLGMSKTPVHQALLDLSTKGFVMIIPKKGFVVRNLTEKDVRDLYEFRIPLEKEVIGHVIDELDETSHEYLRLMVEKMSQTEDPVEFQEHDRNFHRHLVSKTDNRYIINALNDIWSHCDWVGAKILVSGGSFSATVNEHALVAKMMKERDREGAVAAMEDHLERTKEKVLRRLQASREDDWAWDFSQE